VAILRAKLNECNFISFGNSESVAINQLIKDKVIERKSFANSESKDFWPQVFTIDNSSSDPLERTKRIPNKAWEIVKEGLAKYLIGHANIAVMRVQNNDHIVHAKNIDYLKQAGNNTGVIDLILDWYALSLSNVVFAWRRDTDLISTFAQSAQRMSGNTEESDLHAGVGHGIGSKGLQLFFNKRGMPVWREF
jgi:hypothetical protein